MKFLMSKHPALLVWTIGLVFGTAGLSGIPSSAFAHEEPHDATAPSDIQSGSPISLDSPISADGSTQYPIPGIVAPACHNLAQQPLNRCVGRWVQVTELLHDLVYEEIAIPLSAEARSQLATIDQQWQRFRREQCDLEALQLLGGSAYPMTWGSCTASLTNERIAHLQGWGEVTTDEASATQALHNTYGALRGSDRQHYDTLADAFAEDYQGTDRDTAPTLEVSQLLWLDYRDAHCEFEAAYLTTPSPWSDASDASDGNGDASIGDRLSQCRTRLTVERIAHLDNLSWMGW